MKIYTRLLFLFLFHSFIAVSKCRLLTEEENQRRVKMCGRERFAPSSSTSHSVPWITTVGFRTLDELHVDHATGTFISPRHILTSSQPVMNERFEWIWNGKPSGDQNYVPKTHHLRVPLESMKEAKTELVIGRNMRRFEVRNAWILNCCTHESAFLRAPMIIELKEDMEDVRFPCLARESAVLNVRDSVHIYSRNTKSEGQLVHRTRNILSFDSVHHLIRVASYKSSRDRGNAMIDNRTEQTQIVGIAGSTFPDMAENKSDESYLPPAEYCYRHNCYETFFFDLRPLNRDICFLTGICDVLVGEDGNLGGTMRQKLTEDEEKGIWNSRDFDGVFEAPADFFNGGRSGIGGDQFLAVLTVVLGFLGWL